MPVAMRRVRPLLLILLSGCALFSGNRRGWEGEMRHGLLQSPLPEGLIVTSIGHGSTQTVTVANHTGIPLRYIGYRRQSPQKFYNRLENGRWVEGPYDFCLVGMRGYTLDPGESLDMEIGYPGWPSQVFTVFRSADVSYRHDLVLLAEFQDCVNPPPPVPEP